MAEAIKFAHEAIKVQCEAQTRLRKAAGKTEIREYEVTEEDEDLKQKIYDAVYQKAYDVAKQGSTKHERSEAILCNLIFYRMVPLAGVLKKIPRSTPCRTYCRF